MATNNVINKPINTIADAGANANITSMTGLTGALKAPTFIDDVNGNHVVGFTATASAVNYIEIVNNVASNGPIIKASGISASMGISLEPKNNNIAIIDSTGTIAPQLLFFNAAATHFTGLHAAIAQASDITWVLPFTDAVGGIWQSDGSGNLSCSSTITPMAVKFNNGANTHQVTLQAAVGLVTDPTFTLPSAIGAANSVMTDNGSGILSLQSKVNASTLPTGTQFNTISTNLNTTFSTASTTYTNITGLAATITPTSATNKVLVRATIWVSTPATDSAMLQLARGSTAIGVGATTGSRTSAGGVVTAAQTNHGVCVTMEFLDSPATTSPTTYNVQIGVFSGAAGTVQVNRSVTDTNSALFERTSSTITVCEIVV